mmetsp:Transcript_127300/g.207153  ORF Transcript_127300/g.207153 Transcript_127300/m.207153 type:complete len:346 (-) Transcript_127300:477-1514(-)
MLATPSTFCMADSAEETSLTSTSPMAAPSSSSVLVTIAKAVTFFMMSFMSASSLKVSRSLPGPCGDSCTSEDVTAVSTGACAAPSLASAALTELPALTGSSPLGLGLLLRLLELGGLLGVDCAVPPEAALHIAARSFCWSFLLNGGTATGDGSASEVAASGCFPAVSSATRAPVGDVASPESSDTTFKSLSSTRSETKLLLVSSFVVDSVLGAPDGDALAWPSACGLCGLSISSLSTHSERKLPLWFATSKSAAAPVGLVPMPAGAIGPPAASAGAASAPAASSSTESSAAEPPLSRRLNCPPEALAGVLAADCDSEGNSDFISSETEAESSSDSPRALFCRFGA